MALIKYSTSRWDKSILIMTALMTSSVLLISCSSESDPTDVETKTRYLAKPPSKESRLPDHLRVPKNQSMLPSLLKPNE